MKVQKFKDKDAWLAARRGKITGSRLSGVITKRGNGKKIGFYELIAERIATEPDGDETPLDRGTRLEGEALERFERETGKTPDNEIVLWLSDENESIAVSPDATLGSTEAIEVKCLSSARHIEAWITKQVPDEYKDQTIQYFIVNEKLKKLNVVFYDPRIPVKDFFILEIKRSDVQEKIDEYLEYQRNILKEVDEIVLSLTF